MDSYRDFFLYPGLLLICFLTASCSQDSAPSDPVAPTPEVTQENGLHNKSTSPAWLDSEEDGQWTMPAKNYASTRYSGLEQINRDNVKDLKLAWTFSTGLTPGHEAAPVFVDDTLYVVTPYPNTVYALALDGSKKWEYKPDTHQESQGMACCDVVNRGLVHADGKLFFNTLDNHAIALEAATGKELWKTRVGDLKRGETMTMAPLVVKGKMLVGNSGGEMGVRGWLKALDTQTGELLWTAYSTGPDKEVLIGEDFRPFYPQDQGKDLGASSWPPEMWKIGGGTVWGWLSYDPELDLVYYGTGNPGPWNPDFRPGDNKWTLTVFARRPDDGSAIWAYQIEPHDLYDYDGVNESLLLDLPINGEQRKVLVRPERNGHVYVMDRASGEVLSANTYVPVNVTEGVDLKTGQLRKVKDKRPGTNKTVHNICPAAPGGKDWQPSAYSPRTGLIYMPHNNLCMDMHGTQANYIAGTPYVGSDVKMFAGPGGHRGVYTAWDPVAGGKVWSIKEDFPVWSGTVATAGDIVFYGTMDRWFKAVDAKTGELLWKFRVGSGIVGQPVTFQDKDGKQYVAIFSGVGGWSGAIVSGGLDARDGTAALGFANAMKDLPQHTDKGGQLYVFSL
ncbi:methanol/ethanol family PQQ-dependent dehydrogenase [Methylobacillus pratensis]